MTNEDELLIAESTSAWRPASARGELRFHPAWHDLDVEGRREAYEQTRRLRAMEAALDSRGLSSTARAVLARIKGSPR
jgi:hypothetical protein